MELLSMPLSSYRLVRNPALNPPCKPSLLDKTNRFPKAAQHHSAVDLHSKYSSRALHYYPSNLHYSQRSFLACPTPYDTTIGRSGTLVRAQVGEEGISDPNIKRSVHFIGAFWEFLRPHTIRGTIFASFSWAARALIENPQGEPLKMSLVLKALSGLFALICANGYIVGINQIYDIDIDKINKPYLPLAARDFTVQTAWTLCLSFVAAGVFTVIANRSSPFILLLYCLSLFLGYIYSVPPLRLKRFDVIGYLIIVGFRGFLLNFGIYSALRATLEFSFQWTTPMTFMTAFTMLFAFVIGITKDLPDVEGDRKYQIATSTVKLGVRNMTFLGSGLLLLNYMVALATAILVTQSFKPFPMIPAHFLLASSLVFQLSSMAPRQGQLHKGSMCQVL